MPPAILNQFVLLRPSYLFFTLIPPADVPLPEILANPDTYVKADGYDSTIVVCRLGNDSQIAADALRASSADQSASAAGAIVDLIGGLTAWSKDVDSRFPIY